VTGPRRSAAGSFGDARLGCEIYLGKWSRSIAPGIDGSRRRHASAASRRRVTSYAMLNQLDLEITFRRAAQSRITRRPIRLRQRISALDPGLPQPLAFGPLAAAGAGAHARRLGKSPTKAARRRDQRVSRRPEGMWDMGRGNAFAGAHPAKQRQRGPRLRHMLRGEACCV